jgi:endonuclease G
MKTNSVSQHVWPLRAAVALGIGFLAACQTVTEVSMPAIYSAPTMELQAGLSPAEKAAIEKNCYAGKPVVLKATGKPLLIAREGYVLTHSPFLRGPIWVSEGITASQLVGSGNRQDNFAPDPKVPPADRAELRDYEGSGYDRGHQAPAADFKSSQKLTDESFYLSNMAPQVGAGFNRAVWAHLEDFVRERIKENGSGYVITGPLYYDPAEDDPRTADGIVKVKWIRRRVAVPTHFFKIMVLPKPGGKASCVGFVLENRKHPTGSPHDFSQYIKSVDWIEERAGINFMPDLDPLKERELEGKPGRL